VLPIEVEKALFNVKKEYLNALLVTVLDEIDENEDVLYAVARPLSVNELNIITQVMGRDNSAGMELILINSIKFIFSLTREEEISLSDLPFGSAQKLAEDIYQLVGLESVSILINELAEFRQVSSTVMYAGARFIMKAFSQYSLKDIKNLTRTEFAELIMLAEGIHGTEFLIQDPASMKSEEQLNQKELQAIHKEARTNSKLFDFGEENQKLAEHM